ncbi:DUF3883 domain-containing protein [Polaribacter porphyrae]|uniref:Protein NO VEIN C-terminal domain-containing protein n=1 Tax=Polaribacter porphyrae TaxID=1137780 RepID=A0A2S7WPA2_9FLAO|nr:DUF3883 domain-containing protein [Polaribacter porphyrae]PQJ79430.1 hypothetical protein BTO18_09715 [Polaribacter porphyrae]
MKENKHENYEILNLLGYGLSKFDNDFIKEFGFSTKNSFYQYFVDINIVETGSVVKNRMDLLDPFFPNKRKGWWHKGDTYLHRKQTIDNLFGSENAHEYANVVKLFLNDKYNIDDFFISVKPIIKTRYKKMQETGLEAELYFLNNYNTIDIFKNGTIEDARLYGDGYDFQVNVNEHSFLTEVKGIREKKGKFRLTEKEYKRAKEYQKDYIITLVLNLNDSPTFLTIDNPIQNLNFRKKVYKSKKVKEYHLASEIF